MGGQVRATSRARARGLPASSRLDAPTTTTTRRGPRRRRESVIEVDDDDGDGRRRFGSRSGKEKPLGVQEPHSAARGEAGRRARRRGPTRIRSASRVRLPSGAKETRRAGRRDENHRLARRRGWRRAKTQLAPAGGSTSSSGVSAPPCSNRETRHRVVFRLPISVAPRDYRRRLVRWPRRGAVDALFILFRTTAPRLPISPSRPPRPTRLRRRPEGAADAGLGLDGRGGTLVGAALGALASPASSSPPPPSSPFAGSTRDPSAFGCAPPRGWTSASRSRGAEGVPRSPPRRRSRPAPESSPRPSASRRLELRHQPLAGDGADEPGAARRRPGRVPARDAPRDVVVVREVGARIDGARPPAGQGHACLDSAIFLVSSETSLESRMTTARPTRHARGDDAAMGGGEMTADELLAKAEKKMTRR